MPIWARVATGIAACRVLIAMSVYLSGQISSTAAPPLPWSVYALLTAAFGGLGVALVGANRQDARAEWLGGVFLLGAVPLSAPFLAGRPLDELGWLRLVRPDAFMPALLWGFVSSFPTPLTGRPAAVTQLVTRISAVTGLVLALATLSFLVTPAGSAQNDWRSLFVPVAGSGSLYYPLTFGMNTAAFALLLSRARGSGSSHRRQVMLFTGGLVGGSLPLILQASLEAIPAYYDLVHQPGVELVVGAIVFGALATIPFVTAYSVLFDRVVELRLVLRAALQYALARYSMFFLTLVPFLSLGFFVASHRTEPIVALLSGPRPIVLTGMAAVGFLAFRQRQRLLNAVDRRFFREQYDPQQLLDDFVKGVLHAATPADLDSRVQHVFEQALHAEARLLVANEALGVFERPLTGANPIGLSGILASLASADPAPMVVDPNDLSSPFRRLPLNEQRWLLDGQFRVLLAVRPGEGSPVALLALSSKRSGLPFSEADRRLISAVGSAASLTLQNLRLRSLTPDPLAPAARECLRCCTLHPTDAAACPCGGQLQEALAPHVLRGVYRLECRIGSGGMGIVYQGRDLNLERLVAVKTLPRMAIGSAARLRREARAMAAVVHPNLAVIHGVETWRDIPFLVQEYLAGGTLAAKLATARLSIPDALDLGCTLAGALNALHQAGLVHRDIKPSNIGFTHSGVLKLLDFGLARQLEAVGCGSDDTTVSGAHGRRSRVAEITDHALVGTPPYMSPEALLNHPPQPSFDLWSLCVVLYESIACRRPFDGRDAIEMIELLASRRVVPPSRLIEGCPPAVDAFFERAFSMDAVHRPGSAQTLKVELAGLHRSVG